MSLRAVTTAVQAAGFGHATTDIDGGHLVRTTEGGLKISVIHGRLTAQDQQGNAHPITFDDLIRILARLRVLVDRTDRVLEEPW